MGVLGKDLFYYSNNFFEFTALFSSEGIEIFKKFYKPCEITTAFLNYDIKVYVGLAAQLKEAHINKDENTYNQLAEKTNELIKTMPLFCYFKSRHNLLKAAFYNPFLENEKPSDPFRNADGYFTLSVDLETIDRRYKWFLKEIFYKTFPKTETNRYAYQIENNGMDALVSGVSLGEDEDVDPARISIQFQIAESAKTGEPELFEKMVFTRLIDFIYMDFFKGTMKEYCPKKCKLCGKYFLQEPSHTYEYCDNVAPNETNKTCRDIGATKSFKSKVDNDPVWLYHQRAYKKYYARKMKKKMTNAEFLAWADMAEKLRDETITDAYREKRLGREPDLSEYVRKLNEI